jgi:hypothetical protein
MARHMRCEDSFRTPLRRACCRIRHRRRSSCGRGSFLKQLVVHARQHFLQSHALDAQAGKFHALLRKIHLRRAGTATGSGSS